MSSRTINTCGFTFKNCCYCLTSKVISNKLGTMNTELDALEQKIEQMVAQCGRLGVENRALRDQIEGLEQQQAALLARAEQARTRLESLINKLPVG